MIEKNQQDGEQSKNNGERHIPEAAAAATVEEIDVKMTGENRVVAVAAATVPSAIPASSAGNRTVAVSAGEGGDVKGYAPGGRSVQGAGQDSRDCSAAEIEAGNGAATAATGGFCDAIGGASGGSGGGGGVRLNGWEIEGLLPLLEVKIDRALPFGVVFQVSIMYFQRTFD